MTHCYKVPNISSSLSPVKQLVYFCSKNSEVCEGSNHEAIRLMDWWRQTLFLFSVSLTALVTNFPQRIHAISTISWKKYSFKISCLHICLRRSSIWDVERSLLRFHITCQENNFGLLSLSWHTAFHFLSILESVNIGEYWTQFNSKCWHHLTSNVMYIG